MPRLILPMTDDLCEHKTLAFATGGLYVTCFDCGQLWIAVKPSEADGYRYSEPVIDQDASQHGLTLADTRFAPGSKRSF